LFALVFKAYILVYWSYLYIF